MPGKGSNNDIEQAIPAEKVKTGDSDPETKQGKQHPNGEEAKDDGSLADPSVDEKVSGDSKKDDDVAKKAKKIESQDEQKEDSSVGAVTADDSKNIRDGAGGKEPDSKKLAAVKEASGKKIVTKKNLPISKNEVVGKRGPGRPRKGDSTSNNNDGKVGESALKDKKRKTKEESKPPKKRSRKSVPPVETEKEAKEEETVMDAEDDSSPRKDGRFKNKGSAKRESYSVAFKARVVLEFEAWVAKEKARGKEPTVREYVLSKNLGQRYYKFLSPTSGWRRPKIRQRILEDAGCNEYKDMNRMTDRSKNKSYYAEMEEGLLKRLEEYQKMNITVSSKMVRELAKEELRKVTDDEEKIKAFKASNGWVYNFVKRQERKEREQKRKAKLKAKADDQPTAGSLENGGDTEQAKEGAIGTPGQPNLDALVMEVRAQLQQEQENEKHEKGDAAEEEKLPALGQGKQQSRPKQEGEETQEETKVEVEATTESVAL